MTMRRSFRPGCGALAGILGVVTALALTGCGGVDFAGHESADQTPRYASLTWWWPCAEGGGSAVPKPTTANDIVVVGKGPHDIPWAKMAGVPVTMSGEICPPAKTKRDVVFVVDVSRSMDWNDPLDTSTRTCGRLDAIKAVGALLGDNSDARFAAVTFSDGTKPIAASSAFFGSIEDMFADLAKSGGETQIENVLCGHESGTDYDIALNAAAKIMTEAASGASREVYFISDGQPDPDENNGVKAAMAMKSDGVMIATIMLKGTDKYMEKDIASRDDDGNPRHATLTDAAQLTDALLKLTSNEITRGVFRYRPVGSEKWIEFNLLSHQKNLVYTLPPFRVGTLDGGPVAGYEVSWEYWDKHGRRFAEDGKLNTGNK